MSERKKERKKERESKNKDEKISKNFSNGSFQKPVWPDWAIFESSWHQIILQKYGDPWDILENITSKENYCGQI